MEKSRIICSLFIIAVFAINYANCEHKNKYSREANIAEQEKYDADFRNIEKPFRMAKMNVVWAKAIHRLTEPKLKSLYYQLKLHDKELLSWKEKKHLDKEGRKENELRQKLIDIMKTYDLLEHFHHTEDVETLRKHRKFHTDKSEDYINKSLFKDKKLNNLWEKAEVAGFTNEELKALKEEFNHHQDKIDIYYSLLDDLGTKTPPKTHENAINEDELDEFNEINKDDGNHVATNEKEVHTQTVNELRGQHRYVKDNIDRLERIVSRGPNNKDFIEPKVQGLWRVALHSNFSDTELDSLRHELNHYEARLLKLRHLHAEHALGKEKYKTKKVKDKSDGLQDMEDHIKKQTRKVEKMHEAIENQIYKHSEL